MPGGCYCCLRAPQKPGAPERRGMSSSVSHDALPGDLGTRGSGGMPRRLPTLPVPGRESNSKIGALSLPVLFNGQVLFIRVEKSLRRQRAPSPLRNHPARADAETYPISALSPALEMSDTHNGQRILKPCTNIGNT